MPELPDVVVYLERLEALVGGERLQKVRLASPWVLRTFDPPISAVEGRKVTGFRRIGKRLVFELEGDLFVVVHLMIAGRLRMRDPGAAIPKKRGLAAFDFEAATFLLTEEGTKKRASIHVVRGEKALAEHDRGGVEPFEATLEQFSEGLRRERHTLKRSLTDAGLFSGIGGAYADEIMHRAKVSPIARTDRLTDDEIARLHAATSEVLAEWVDRLRDEAGDGFPEKVTAFRDEMAVHGKFGQPCPVCGNPVQRIVYASNETNYCAGCQTDGKILADRALSRLLKEDFPRSLEELE
ncbi:MAG TPA: DNA-formamidopyrimidine glycosylase family protein [Acidimicrobiia bacterium]|nr:DNA-formamidopyrimidine glycosylase family protein [Acidimicrobiia bacterium]